MDDHTRPEFAASALLTIDLQRDFVDGAAAVPGTAEVLPAVRRLTEAFRTAGRPVVHVVRLYLPDGGNADLCRRTVRGVATPDTPGSQPADGLTAGGDLDPGLLLAGGMQEVGPAEHVMYKPRWSAFFATPLAAHLAERGVTTVVVAGCNYPNCPRATLVEATERDLRTVAVRDATSAWTTDADRELPAMGIACLTAAEVVAQVTAGPRNAVR